MLCDHILVTSAHTVGGTITDVIVKDALGWHDCDDLPWYTWILCCSIGLANGPKVMGKKGSSSRAQQQENQLCPWYDKGNDGSHSRRFDAYTLNRSQIWIPIYILPLWHQGWQDPGRFDRHFSLTRSIRITWLLYFQPALSYNSVHVRWGFGPMADAVGGMGMKGWKQRVSLGKTRWPRPRANGWASMPELRLGVVLPSWVEERGLGEGGRGWNRRRGQQYAPFSFIGCGMWMRWGGKWSSNTPSNVILRSWPQYLWIVLQVSGRRLENEI